MGQGYSIRAKANAAEIYIYEDVGEGWFGGVSAKQFATDLKALGAVNQIELRINSYGGDVFDGLAIYRQLVEHPAKVVSHIDGIAASIASVIAMAGDTVEIAEAGFVMIHNASGGCLGCADDMRSMASLLDTITATIADVYSARTGLGSQALLAMMEAETWLTAGDAVTQGFADSVAENLRVAAHADASRHRFMHAPEALALPTTAIIRPDRDALPKLQEVQSRAADVRPAAMAAAATLSHMRNRRQRAAMTASGPTAR